MSLQHAYNTFRNNLGTSVAKDSAEECPCRGYGWILSPFDTHHKCPRHYEGQRHPEDGEYAYATLHEVFVAPEDEGEGVVEGKVVPRYQVKITIGHCDYGGDGGEVDEEESFLHFHEFECPKKAQEFGNKIAMREDISRRVQNKEYWVHYTRPGTLEDFASLDN